MKKIYTTHVYRLRQKRISRKRIRLKQKRKRLNIKHIPEKIKNKSAFNNSIQDFIDPKYAPPDFRLLVNTEDCLEYFRYLRSDAAVTKGKIFSFAELHLTHVTQVDYSTLSILIAIRDDLKAKNILLKGKLPRNAECSIMIQQSGFLNQMYNENGRPFAKAKDSDLLLIERGSGKFSTQDSENVTKIVKRISKHLVGHEDSSKELKSIVLEICGNSIEWSEAKNKQWLLGVRYENERVIVTITDVGKGILKTLYRKHHQIISEKMRMNTSDEVLMGAFEKKYGSKSKKANRNKGLPSIKKYFTEGKIKELKVITNNVILHFDDTNQNKTFPKGNAWLKGTFYRWVITKECLN